MSLSSTPNPPLTRDQVFQLINGERSYQNEQAEQWNHQGAPSIEAELLMLEHYISDARQAWVQTSHSRGTLDNIRKIAGIAVRALEHHGSKAGPQGPIRYMEK